jgi:phosphohistidine phosphatase
MSRELLILRHGKSDWGTGLDDFSRPITDRGKRSAQRVGVWLAEQGLQPDYVVSSPAERAITTTQKALKAMGGDAKGIKRDRRIYAAGLNTLLAVLEDVPTNAKRVLIVGHNPGLEELLEHLVGSVDGLIEGGKLLPTATLAHLEMPETWNRNRLRRGCARLLSLTRPRSLPKKFPFPGPGGRERRDRPAYYYHQSSVIPYRMGKKGLEILVISSSQNKHPVVPKGIIDPGLSPQESAAKEAWEEAGVEGEIDAKALGVYRYPKWGAECEVEVFPMRVTREIPENEWEESHRGRQWLAAAKAAERVKQQALAPLIDVLVKRLK